MAFDKPAPARPKKVSSRARRPTAVDLFCGIGGMSLGFEQAGFDVVAAVDFDPLLAAVHKFNHPSTRTICRDVASLKGQARVLLGLRKRKIDVVFGGPPCQGFSSIGKRQVDDARNKLVETFVAVATEIVPRYIVMENVEGILQPAMRGHLKTAKELLAAKGYAFAEPVKVDASEYGVPQKRRRVFLVAWRKGEPEFRWPAKTHGKGDNLLSLVTVRDAIGDLSTTDPTPASAYSKALGSLSTGNARPRLGAPEGLTGLEATKHHPDTVKRFEATEEGREEPTSRYTRLRWEGLCHTMRAGTGPDRGSFMSARPIHPSEPRVINVREAARLHGYPDWFQFHKTKWHSFRGIGNSVPPPVACAIAKSLIRCLGAKELQTVPIPLGPPTLLQLDPTAAATEFGIDPSARPRRTKGMKPSVPK